MHSALSNQKNLISCSNDKKIKLWKIADNKELAEFDGHTRAVKNAF